MRSFLRPIARCKATWISMREFFRGVFMQRPALLVIVRHAESSRNLVKKDNVYMPDDESASLVVGVPDHKIPITEVGHRQARETGAALREQFGVFDVVYDSGYLRSKETLDEILKAYSEEESRHMRRRTSHLLRERDSGYTYDMTTDEVDQYFPYFRAYWKQFGYFYARPPGGESQSDVCERVYRFVGILFKQRPGKRVLIVTHGGTSRALRFNLEKWTADDYEKDSDSGKRHALPNCGLIVYRYDESTGRLELEECGNTYWKEKDKEEADERISRNIVAFEAQIKGKGRGGF